VAGAARAPGLGGQKSLTAAYRRGEDEGAGRAPFPGAGRALVMESDDPDLDAGDIFNRPEKPDPNTGHPS